MYKIPWRGGVLHNYFSEKNLFSEKAVKKDIQGISNDSNALNIIMVIIHTYFYTS
jgi:hypothetical protein